MLEYETVPLLMTIGGLAVLLILEQIIPASQAGRGGIARHGAGNLALGLVNGAGVALVATPLLTWMSIWIEREEIGLVSPFGGATGMVTGVILFDGWMYLWHRANHEIGLLWRFHRLHHTDRAMDVTTTVRFHPAEILLSTLGRLLVMPIIGLTIRELLIYEMVLFPVILFHHSNIRFPEQIDRALRWVIVTPSIHRVHHSIDQTETDSNYGSVLSIWDRLGRTIRLRADHRPVIFGLGGENRLP